MIGRERRPGNVALGGERQRKSAQRGLHFPAAEQPGSQEHAHLRSSGSYSTSYV